MLDLRHDTFVEGHAKVKYHCHITENYRGDEHSDYNISGNLIFNTPITLHSRKIYDACLLCKHLTNLILK